MKYQESDNMELKQIFTDKIKQEILAFINTNGGIICVGVNDMGTVTAVAKESMDEYDGIISSWIRDAFYPNINEFIKFYYNNDDVLIIEVKKGKNKPYYLVEKGPKPSGVFIRIGRTSRQATQDEILQMLIESRDIKFEDEISDNQKLHFTEFELMCRKHNFEYNEKKFETLGITNQGQYTKLGLLISDENPIIVKFAVYADNTRVEFKVKKEFEGSIIKIADQVIEYANLYNDTSAKIVDYQAQRIETKSYPGVSVREAVLNAICHCNYSLSSNIKIEFFKDRVEISSPGSIYGGLSIEDIIAGKQATRNLRLVNVLSKLDIIENYGTGIERMFEAYAPYNIKPILSATNSFFSVILSNMNYIKFNEEDIDNKNGDKKMAIKNGNKKMAIKSGDKKTTSKTIEIKEKIIKYIKANAEAKTIDIAAYLDLGLSRTRLLIKELVDEGKVIAIGGNKNKTYKLKL